jgi:ferredoxin--NADP+ reductase
MKKAGNRVITIIGTRCGDLLFYVEQLGAVSDELLITTDDGSHGRKGFVTEELQRLIDGGTKIDRVVAIGPTIMMKMVSEVTRPYKIPTIVSLNSIMVCGTGMCGSCRVEVDGETKFACVDGPEFDGHKVNFDLLMQRLDMYASQERESDKHFRIKTKQQS